MSGLRAAVIVLKLRFVEALIPRMHTPAHPGRMLDGYLDILASEKGTCTQSADH
jgi:hypothetical protein